MCPSRKYKRSKSSSFYAGREQILELHRKEKEQDGGRQYWPNTVDLGQSARSWLVVKLITKWWDLVMMLPVGGMVVVVVCVPAPIEMMYRVDR